MEKIQRDTNLIELIKLLRYLYEGRRLVVVSVFIAAFLGVFISLMIPNTFTSGAKFLPQTNSSEINAPAGIGGLASLAGFDFSAMGNESNIPTNLYPQIVKSLPFRTELLREKITYEDQEMSLREYLNNQLENPTFFGRIKKYTIGLPGILIGWFKSNNLENTLSKEGEIYEITEEDRNLFRLLSEHLVISIYEAEGIVSIEYSDYNKEVASKVANVATELLQQRIIEFKNQSAKELLAFSKRQYEDYKQDFEILQDSISLFKDTNRYINTSYYKNQLDRLNHELNISSAVLEQLANQVEQSKLQVNKDTPIFMVIEPVATPYEKSSPNRPFIVLAWVFMGILIPFCYLILKDPLKEIARNVQKG